MEEGGQEGKTLLDAMKDGELDGMQHFDGELEKLVRANVITLKTAYSTRPTRVTFGFNCPTYPTKARRLLPDAASRIRVPPERAKQTETAIFGSRGLAAPACWDCGADARRRRHTRPSGVVCPHRHQPFVRES